MPVEDVTSAPFDVAIVGYGPSGVTAANLLGARGLSVLVVERDADIYARARAISTDEEVLRIWQRAGLAERLERDMLAERPIAFVDRDQRPFVEAIPPSHGHGFPPQLFIYQPALEQVLRDGVSRYANVEVRLSTECLRTAQDDDGVELLVVDLNSGSLERVWARYVIAADGGSSPIRGSLGIGFDGQTYEDRWVVIDTEVKRHWPEQDTLRFHCDPARPAVDCPTPLGHHRWEFPVLPSEDEDALVSDEGVWRLLDGHGITHDDVTVLRAVVYSHHVRFASQWRRGRIFLVGDAAHVMPPWIGQGMAAGVRDVDDLCWKLAEVIQGTLGPSVLDSYEVERQPHVRAITRRAVTVGRLICERNVLVARLRDRVLDVFRLVPRLQPLLWVPAARCPREGFLAGTGHNAEGRKPPQPLVETAAGVQERLDDVIGDTWAVLHLGDEPDGADAWRDVGARILQVDAVEPSGAAVADRDGQLTDWMRRRGADALVLRPDRFVYCATHRRQPLPSPPHRTTLTTEVAA